MFTSEILQLNLTRLTKTSEFLVAYSGGIDSSVLLHAMARLREEVPELSVRAIHINHQINPASREWAWHCQDVCDGLGIECLIRSIQVTPKRGQSLEAVARDLRYKAFKDEIRTGECLLVAHQQDDQVETLLLQLFRGAGPKGLAAMPSIVPFGQGRMARPLLGFSRVELQDYAESHGLRWIDDESNHNTQIRRNFIRHRLLPTIREAWPAILETISRSAGHCAEASGLLEDLAELDTASVQVAGTSQLVIPALLKLSEARQRNVLRHWLQQRDLPLPNTKRLYQIQSDMLHCSRDAMPLVTWPGVEVRRYRDALYAMRPLSPHDPGFVIPWDLKGPLVLPGDLGVLYPEHLKGHCTDPTALKNVTVRFRQGGERYHPIGQKFSWPLKQYLQEQGIPPWLRDRIPLIYDGDRLVVVF